MMWQTDTPFLNLFLWAAFGHLVPILTHVAKELVFFFIKTVLNVRIKEISQDYLVRRFRIKYAQGRVWLNTLEPDVDRPSLQMLGEGLFILPALRVVGYLHKGEKIHMQGTRVRPQPSTRTTFVLTLFTTERGLLRVLEELQKRDRLEAVQTVPLERMNDEYTALRAKPGHSLRDASHFPDNWEHPITRAQADIVRAILQRYTEKLSCSVILTGPPGTGKSTIAEYMATALHDTLVVQGFNPLSGRHDLSEARFGNNTTLILVLDEVDLLFRRAQRSRRRTAAAARDDSSDEESDSLSPSQEEMLHQFLDFVAKPGRRIVTLMTTNLTRADLEHQFPRMVRGGRVHIFAQLEARLAQDAEECAASSTTSNNVLADTLALRKRRPTTGDT